MRRGATMAVGMLAMAMAAPAWAVEDIRLTLANPADAFAAPGLSVERLSGGASDGLRLKLALSPYFAAGPLITRHATDPFPADPATAGGGLELGGHVEVALQSYRFDGSLRGGDGLGGEVGAAYQGDAYRVRLGAGWGDAAEAYFSVNQAFGSIGWADTAPSGRDVNLSLSFSHAITPNLSVSGIAAARRDTAGDGIGGEPDRYMVGAGVGLKF